MKPYVLEQVQDLPTALDEVFPFFERPENLERITPPWMKMTILTPEPTPMHVGSAIDYSVSVHGLPMRWTSLISEYDPPNRFVDVQLRGPYSFWHHTHEFEALQSGTRVIDRVHYMPPLGPVGRLAHAVMIKRDLDRIFAYRREYLGEYFAA